MNKNNIIIKNIISSLINQIVCFLYGFIIPIFIIKTFGSEINGLISSIAQFLAYISLLEGGVGPVIKNALFKPLVKKNNEEISKILGTTDNFFKKLSYIFILYIIILCVFYPMFVEEYTHLFTISMILIISINYLSEYYLGITYILFLKSDQKNYLIDNINTISYIFNLIVIIVLIKLGFGILWIKLISSFVYVIKPIILRIYFNRKYNIKIIKDKSYKLEKKWDGLTHHIASIVQSNTDILLLTTFSNLVNVSIYSVHSLVTNGINSLINSLTNGIDAFFGKKLVESNRVNSTFDSYCFVFYTLITMILTMTLILIVPFISVYTRSISDANYVNPIFAYLLIFAQFFRSIGDPYASIVYANGNFKETSKYAVVQPIINIVISLILIKKFGLIGVAIGTLFSAPIRSIGFIYYGSNYILNKKFFDSIKIIIISLFEMISVFCIYILLGGITVSSYYEWILSALTWFVPVTIFIITLNVITFNNTFKKCVCLLKKTKKWNVLINLNR